MKERCIEIEQLDALLRLDAASPRRRHVEECPRCRALLAVYQEFLEDGSIPPGADPSQAATLLRARFAAALQEAPLDRGVGAVKRSAGLISLVAILRPALRPAWALAFVLLLSAGVYGGRELLRHRDGPSRTRGVPAAAHEQPAGRLSLLAARLRSDGSLELRWRRVAQADDYEVRAFGPDLIVAGNFEAGDDTLVILPAEELRRILPPGLAGFQVIGRQRGQEIVSSNVRTVGLR